VCTQRNSRHAKWRRPIGWLKLQVVFCNRATKYRALLRTIIFKDQASYRSLPPYITLSLLGVFPRVIGRLFLCVHKCVV